MFSSKTYLALLVILELSRKDQTGPLTSRNLASKYNVSKRYLEVVFNNLAKSGLISSKRGIGGGYFLTADTEKLSIFDLAVAAEGGLKIFSGGDFLEEKGDRAGNIGSVNNFWQKMDSDIMQSLKGYIIKDLITQLSDYKEMYYI